MIKNQNIWVRYGNKNPDAKMRLFCLPYAGASALIYNKWQNKFDGFLEVQPIQLPGRENRYSEDYDTSAKALVKNISEGIEPYLDKPFAVFGHSMGAILGYELSCEIVRRFGKKPVALFISGSRCPKLMSDYRPGIYNLPDDEFFKTVQGYNGIDHELFSSDEYKDYFIPILRNDFKTVETYFYEANPLLECPIRVYCGVNDANVVMNQVIQWSEHTSAGFSYKMFEGDHFFINKFTRDICQDIEKVLISVLEEKNEFCNG